jgi:hypothetical protein
MSSNARLKRIAIILGVVVVVLIAANVFVIVADIPGKDKPANAPSPVTTPTEVQAPGPAPVGQLKVGDTFTAGNWQYTVIKTDKRKTIASADARSDVQAKGTYQVVQVKAVNISKDPHAIGPSDFELRDALNNVYQADSLLGWPGGSCVPGGVVTVELVFDVGQSASGAKLFLPQVNQSVDLGQ